MASIRRFLNQCKLVGVYSLGDGSARRSSRYWISKSGRFNTTTKLGRINLHHVWVLKRPSAYIVTV